jgi:hypothetical protein
MASGILDSALAYLNAAYVVMTLIKVRRDQTFGWGIRWRSGKYDYTTRDETLSYMNSQRFIHSASNYFEF